MKFIKKHLMLTISITVTVVGLILSTTGFVNYTTAESINANDPMFPIICIGLFAFVSGLVLTLKSVFDTMTPESKITYTKKERTVTMVQAALFAALAYVLFMFFKIDIPVGAEKTAFHLGNTMVALAALLLGGTWGGLSGAIGLTLADFTSGYVTSAPKTFFLKLCIGLITGFFAHRVFKISKTTDRKKITVGTVVSVSCGLLFNVVADPLTGYFYKLYLFGIPQDAAKALAKISSLTTAVNALLSAICAIVLYIALRPALKRSGYFKEI